MSKNHKLIKIVKKSKGKPVLLIEKELLFARSCLTSLESELFPITFD
jgi:hypothetical protein